MFIGSLKKSKSTLKQKYTPHTHGYGIKKEDTCTMSDIDLKCIEFGVCIPILHFKYITEYWNITKPFDIETPDFLCLKKNKLLMMTLWEILMPFHPWDH